MRIVDRHELMAMPVPTMYREVNGDCEFGPLLATSMILSDHDGKPIDWCYWHLARPDHHDFTDLLTIIGLMASDSKRSHPGDRFAQRDGCFDDTDRFLVLEARDLEWIDMIVALARNKSNKQ